MIRATHCASADQLDIVFRQEAIGTHFHTAHGYVVVCSIM